MTSTHGNTSVGQPAKTYIHQLCADTGCCLKQKLIGTDGETLYFLLYLLRIKDVSNMKEDESINFLLAESVGAVKYIDCFSAEG